MKSKIIDTKNIIDQLSAQNIWPDSWTRSLSLTFQCLNQPMYGQSIGASFSAERKPTTPGGQKKETQCPKSGSTMF